MSPATESAGTNCFDRQESSQSWICPSKATSAQYKLLRSGYAPLPQWWECSAIFTLACIQGTANSRGAAAHVRCMCFSVMLPALGVTVLEDKTACPLLSPFGWSTHTAPTAWKPTYCLQWTPTESDHQVPGQLACQQFPLASFPASCSLLCIPPWAFPHSHFPSPLLFFSAQNNRFPQYTHIHSQPTAM